MNKSQRLGWRPIAAAYLVCLLGLALLDAVWLGYVAADFYRDRIGHLMAATPRVDAAVAFYLIYPAAIVLFAIKPAIDASSPSRGAKLGAAFGFFAYATYDLTNLATLRDWSVPVSVLDVAWGAAISAVLAWLGQRAACAVVRKRRDP